MTTPNATTQSISPFKWMTDSQSYTEPTPTNNTAGKVPRSLVDTSSSLLQINSKLSASVPSYVSETLGDHRSLGNLTDANVKASDLVGTFTRKSLNTSYSFSGNGERLYNRDNQHRDISEKQFTFTLMEELPASSTSRPGILVQSKWEPEPQLIRGGQNTRFDER